MAESPVQVCSEPAIYRPRTRGCLRMLRGEWEGIGGAHAQVFCGCRVAVENSPLKVCALFMIPGQYRLTVD